MSFKDFSILAVAAIFSVELNGFSNFVEGHQRNISVKLF